VPVAEEPLGYDHERRFEQHYPRIELPFQLVDTVETGIKRRYEKDELFPNGLNRLFFGDCLHVMRMLPSECIDLIYIDPPFFSGRNYNIIFGDKNEVRSFTDIWEGGMPATSSGSTPPLRDEASAQTDRPVSTFIWTGTRATTLSAKWIGSSDMRISMRTLSGATRPDSSPNDTGIGNTTISSFHKVIRVSVQLGGYKSYRVYDPGDHAKYKLHDEIGRIGFVGRGIQGAPFGRRRMSMQNGRRHTRSWLCANYLGEVMPHPTIGRSTFLTKSRTNLSDTRHRKPERLLERIISASSNEGECWSQTSSSAGGTSIAGGATPWPPLDRCDISRVAVALTADRIARILAPNLDDIKRAAKKAKKAKPQEN